MRFLPHLKLERERWRWWWWEVVFMVADSAGGSGVAGGNLKLLATATEHGNRAGRTGLWRRKERKRKKK